MSFDIVIFVTLFFVSYVVQLLAFEQIGARWNKTDISWGIEEDAETIDRQTVIAAAKDAFGKWAAESSLHFTGPVSKPDIKIKFVSYVRGDNLCATEYVGDGYFEGDVFIVGDGARIRIKNRANWTDPDGEWYCNIHIALLHEIGHALGLDDSPVAGAVMSRAHQHVSLKSDFDLHKDDILGIQSLYGPPSSGTPWSTRQPSSYYDPPRHVTDRNRSSQPPPLFNPHNPPRNVNDRRRPTPSYTPRNQSRDVTDHNRSGQHGGYSDGFHPRARR